MVFFLVAIIVGMIDPIVAGLGIGIGILAPRHLGWAMALAAAGMAGLLVLHVSAASAFQEVPSLGRLILQWISVGIWALITFLIGRRFIPKQ